MDDLITCKECGVALEQTMLACPLCNTSLTGHRSDSPALNVLRERSSPTKNKKSILSRILWQIVAILLLSGIAATFVINLAIQGALTWCIYPISICLMILSYVSLMSLWKTRKIYQLTGGWILSSLVLVIVGQLTSEDWPLRLALPILCAFNIVAFSLIFMLRSLTTRGLNGFAFIILGLAILCVIIEAILSYYFQRLIRLQWSAIVTACLLPVAATVLFMYYRTRNNEELKKIFHI